MSTTEKNILDELQQSDYKYGFTTDIETEIIPKGLSEEVVRLTKIDPHSLGKWSPNGCLKCA